MVPSQNDADIALSKGLYEQIPAYMAAKYAADKDLSQRTAFEWTVVRPGFLSDDPGTGKITAGRTHITANIPVRIILAFGFHWFSTSTGPLSLFLCLRPMTATCLTLMLTRSAA